MSNETPANPQPPDNSRMVRDGKLTAWLDIEIDKLLGAVPYEDLPHPRRQQLHQALKELAHEYARKAGGRVYVGD